MSDRLSGLWGFVTENFRDLAILAGAYVLATQLGVIEPVPLPDVDVPFWYPLVGLAVLSAAILGMFVGGKIIDLLPDPPRVYLIELTEEEEGNAVWRLTPDTFEELTTEAGRLYQWEETKHPVYECVTYDPEANHAVGTWRESVPASEIVGKSDVKDAIDQITEVRRGMEQEARYGHAIRRRIGAIVRALDRERAADQNAALEGHIAPSVQDGRSTDEVIRDVLGPLVPGYMTDDTEEQLEEIVGGDVEGGDVDLIASYADALEPAATNGGGHE